MKKGVVLIAGMLASGMLHANGWTGNVNIFTGNKSMDSDWGEFDSQGEVGIMSDFGQTNWPALIVVDTYISGKDDNKDAKENDDYRVDAVTTEFMIGLRRYFDYRYGISSYLGGGLTIGYAHQEVKQADGTYKKEDDRGYGPWVGTGIKWRPWKHFNLGFDVRYSHFEAELFEKDLSSGGVHAGVNAGFHW
ncbi:outer membrane protein [Vibrio amylolyticus]|uniref:outer membrane protein n=1 Tax=Vibrio amylolyticus TaxID=2847292 RepID=UPI00355361C9